MAKVMAPPTACTARMPRKIDMDGARVSPAVARAKRTRPARKMPPRPQMSAARPMGNSSMALTHKNTDSTRLREMAEAAYSRPMAGRHTPTADSMNGTANWVATTAKRMAHFLDRVDVIRNNYTWME